MPNASMLSLIGITNLSSRVSNAEAKTMTIAIQEQMKLHAAPEWGMDYPIVIFYEDPSQMSVRAYPIALVDNDSTPNALGWHSVNAATGKPYGRIIVDVILDNGGVVLYDPNNPNNYSVSGCLSHEILETWGDRWCNSWMDGPRIIQGSSYSFELADPVEGNNYVINIGKQPVFVSNFVLPEYFNPFATGGKFDYLGVLHAPFSLGQNGYMVVRNAPGTEQQVMAEKVPQWRKEVLQQKSRVSRRLKDTKPAKKDSWWKLLF